MANKKRHLWEDPAGIVHVKLLGQQGPLDHRAVEKRLRDMKLCTRQTPTTMSPQSIFPPVGEDNRGRYTIATSACTDIRADGATLPNAPGSALVMATRDCPSVIVVNTATRAVALGHAGRDSLLMNSDCLTCNAGIISNLVASVCPRGSDRSIVTAHITGGISAKHFCHQHCTEKVRPFHNRWGDRAVPIQHNDRVVWQLDLRWVIVQLLNEQGVPAEHISHDDLCTWETPWLGSKRATEAGIPNKERANWVIVLRR